MHKPRKSLSLCNVAVALLCLFLTASPAIAAKSTTCPPGWQGEYEWDESAPALSGMTSVWSYSITISEGKGSCQARIEGSGVQMDMGILADVQGNAEEISLLYREMLPDAGFGSAGEPGDLLLRLKRKGQGIITHWEKMGPQLEQHEKPGSWFKPVGKKSVRSKAKQ